MWKTEFRCINCEKRLSENQRCYNNGMCPLCGYKDRYAATIAKTTSHAYRLVKTGGFWIWTKYKREYLDD